MIRLRTSLVVAPLLIVLGCGSDHSVDTAPAATTTSVSVTTGAAESTVLPATTGGDVVVLDATDRTATVRAGSTIEVVIGVVNSSIGDDWRLGDVSPPGAVTLVDERHGPSSCATVAPGCDDGPLTWVLQVDGEGTVTFDADNCYRGPCPDDPLAEDEAETRTYTLTVVP